MEEKSEVFVVKYIQIKRNKYDVTGTWLERGGKILLLNYGEKRQE